MSSERVHKEADKHILCRFFLSLCCLHLNAKKPASVVEKRRITAHKNTKGGEPKPWSGNLHTGDEKWLPCGLHHFFSPAVSVVYWSASSWTVPFSKSPPGSIFITIPCMNVQFHLSQQTNHLLRPRMLTLFSARWLICLLSPCSSFISNLKANISGPNITLLPYILSLSPSASLAIESRNHPSVQWGNNGSSLSLGRSDCCTFHYNWDMSDCLGDGG